VAVIYLGRNYTSIPTATWLSYNSNNEEIDCEYDGFLGLSKVGIFRI